MRCTIIILIIITIIVIIIMQKRGRGHVLEPIINLIKNILIKFD
jgi:hypothetical protein